MSEHDDVGGEGRGRGGRGRVRGGRGGGGRGRGGRFGERGRVGSRIKTDRSNSNSTVANASFDDAVIEEHYFSSIGDLQNEEPLTMTGKETEVWLKKALRLVANDDDGIGDGSCFATESSTVVDANATIVEDHVKLEQSPCAKNRLIPSPLQKNDTPSQDAQTQTQQRARSKNKKPKGTSEPTIQGWIGTRSPSEEELLYISSFETADDKSITDELYDDEVVVEKNKSTPSHKEQSVKLKNDRTTANASINTQCQEEKRQKIPTRKEQQKLKQQQQKKERPKKGGCVAVPSPPSSLECAPRAPSSSLFCTPSKAQENNCNVQGLTTEAEQLSQESPSVDAFLSPPPSSEIHADRGGGRGGKGRRGGGGRGTTGRGPSITKDVKPQDPNTDKVVPAAPDVPSQPEISEKAEKKQRMEAIKERKRAEKVAKRQNSHAAEVVITDKALAETSSVPSPPKSDNERLAQVIVVAVAKERKKIEESKKSDKRGSPSTVVNHPVVRTTASVPSLEDDEKEIRLNQLLNSRTSAKGPLPFFQKLRQKKSPSDKGYNDVTKEKENTFKPTQKSPALAVSSTPSQDTHNQRKKPSVSFDTAVADRTVKAIDVVASDQQVDSEKERLACLLREEREKAAAAKDRKKTEKSKKHERWLKEREIEKTRRGEFWQEEIAKNGCFLISQLIVAEVRRQNKGMLADDNPGSSIFIDMLTNDDSCTSRKIAKESRKAHAALFGRRVKVVNSERQDLDGRQGTLRYWNASQGKFCVGLDTKKSKDSDVKFVEPEALEVVATPTPARITTKNNKDAVYYVGIDDVCKGILGIDCRFTLEKDHVDALYQAESIEAGLKTFCIERDSAEDRLCVQREKEKREEEEYRRREEEYRSQAEAERKKRAEQKRKEKAAKQAERDKEIRLAQEEVERMMKKRIKGAYMESIFKSLLNEMLDKELFESQEMIDEFVTLNGLEFDDIGDFMDAVKDFLESHFEEERLKERMEEDEKMAEILGVETDADERTIKVAYRKLALKFHPDKWRSDNDHDMTIEETEEHFKGIVNAYDHFISNINNNDSDDSEDFVHVDRDED